MKMTYNETQQAINSSIEKAKEINIPVTIAIVDTGGHLMNLVRLDSGYGLVDFAIKKARTAIMFGVDSDIMGAIIEGAQLHSYGMINANNGLLTIAGGVLIKNRNGNTIGSIGVSGGTPEQDKEIAEAGAKVLA
ncbi:GlcG/HbpS family heme-binding protein [Sphingobacterium yanglingense]|uniref:Uncharacterized protein GlcG (DUF336 family) n=1 Tax=Sphingobacterium yanglingense TaxID=1437280 RepID=A0A4R6WKP4_9SPHI|nr:heme-binding protein [Sphingobacterium yanglingense]TDQ79348.1 uncharacterized protein GlcG (DUF336 family) [Sphingobacterium yanglingense]